MMITVSSRLQLRNEKYLPLHADPPGFMVKLLPEKGRAVFTTKNVLHGEPLLAYGGELISGEAGERREAREQSGFRYFFTWKGKQLCRDASIEPKRSPRLGRLVNHGWKTQVNSKMKIVEGPDSKPNLVLFALKDIPTNSEILYDYGIPDSFKFPQPPEYVFQLENEKVAEGPPTASQTMSSMTWRSQKK
ncbi:putative N-lysine methyltransferase SETD8-B [Apostichopus japonicus]|uniref:Putative N-lysine methyltransferase SETD8-B n=1 Tax=Stichopus japonicus TaxID=307972 RepID=A0A2G8K8E7_STIJA|nr:putative N-lysine methyltransferase SETD8-B [Apostichopus japonicus]